MPDEIETKEKEQTSKSPSDVAKPIVNSKPSKAKKAKRKRSKAKRVKGAKNSHVNNESDSARTRTARPYPASSFTDALPVAEAIMKFAAGDKVRRLTLLEKMNKTPTTGTTKQMITNSGKYGLTTGSYSAEYLELTENGRTVVDAAQSARERKQAAFDLAIDGVAQFKMLYEQ